MTSLNTHRIFLARSWDGQGAWRCTCTWRTPTAGRGAIDARNRHVQRFAADVIEEINGVKVEAHQVSPGGEYYVLTSNCDSLGVMANVA